MNSNERGSVLGVGTGSLLMWLSSLDVSEWSYLIGAFVALASLAYGFYFAWKKNKRDAEEHALRMEMLRNGLEEQGD